MVLGDRDSDMKGMLFLSSLPSNLPPISRKLHLAIKSKKYDNQFKINKDSIKVISRLKNGIRSKNSDYFSVFFRLLKPYSNHYKNVGIVSFVQLSKVLGLFLGCGTQLFTLTD